MIEKNLPLLVKLVISLGLTLGAVWLSFLVAEKFFFDKIFYQKSGLHGYRYYRNSEFKILNSVNGFDRFFLTQRADDLTQLNNEINQPTRTNSCMTSDLNLVRKRAYSSESPLTIVVIGDSNTYGLGVMAHQRYSEILAKKLNKFVPTKIFTLAEPGNSLEDDYALYLLAKDYLNPDLVIIGILENDLIFNSNKYPNSAWLRSHLQAKCSQDIFSAQSDEFGTESWGSVLKIYQQSFSSLFANRCFLNQISTELSKDKNLLIFSFFDYLTPSSLITDTKEVSIHRNLMFELKNALVSAGNKVIGYNPDNGFFTYASPKEGHPSDEAHLKFAEIIFLEIIQSLSPMI